MSKKDFNQINWDLPRDFQERKKIKTTYMRFQQIKFFWLLSWDFPSSKLYYSGRRKFMPLPLKSKILETPGSLVTDDIKMFPLWIWTLNLQASLIVQYELSRICNYSATVPKVNKLSMPIFLKTYVVKFFFFNWREMLFNGLRWVWSEK